MSRMVLHAVNIRKSYGEREIVAVDDLKINYGDRIGIVGANGAGKTTLLGLLSGRVRPDEGCLKLYAGISYIAQDDDGTPVPDPRLAKEFMVRGLAGGQVSGGEQTRLRIAANFDENAGILFADEPTANLDLDGIRRLEGRLSSFRGALLLVSHDRELLDRLCDTIIEVDSARLRIYRGNYSAYVRQREALRERQRFEYERYIQERGRLERTIGERRERVKGIRKAPKRMGNSEARLHKRESTEIQKKMNRSVKSMETRLEKLEARERPGVTPRVRISLPASGETVSKTVVRGEGVNLYLGDRRVFDRACFEIPRGKRTALVGANGAGKTTLANMIVGGAPGIRTAPGTRIGYLNQDLSSGLRPPDTVLESAMRESAQDETLVRTVLARLLFKGNDVFKQVWQLSGGERVKLSLARVLLSDANLVILDEPTNFLDLYSLEALEGVLEGYEGTLLVISHDRMFLDRVADRVLIIEDSNIKTFEGRLAECYKEDERAVDAPGDRAAVEMMLKIQLAEITGKIASCRSGEERSRLERDYEAVLERLKAL